MRAEQLAELPVIERGGFHAYRRLYAIERKHLPGVDVARSAGWRDLATMKRSYQQPDPVTTLRVIENDAPAVPAADKQSERDVPELVSVLTSIGPPAWPRLNSALFKHLPEAETRPSRGLADTLWTHPNS